MGWSVDCFVADTALIYLGFCFFFIFQDIYILKPGPVQLMDDIKSGTGIMMDDVIAGILALLVTQSLVYFIG